MTRQIVCRIYGGLGNQMFQYAAARAAALRTGAELVLDLGFFARPRPFRYGLGHFAIRGRVAVSADLPPDRISHPVKYRLWRWFDLKPRWMREKQSSYGPQLLTLPDVALLDGYWQSERYFEDRQAEIRDELTMLTPPSDENRRQLESIAEVPAVSLHVRRGDYLLPENAGTLGLCSPEYYRRAIDTIAASMADEPVIFVFSDDPGWVRENLSFPFETRVIGNNDSDHNYEDLRLMTACRHHVVANSSFSWWGAWLNRSPGKIVVGPTQWFTDPAIRNDDITPSEWLRL